jgi:hypothetical protein
MATKTKTKSMEAGKTAVVTGAEDPAFAASLRSTLEGLVS